jgi:predicted transposase YbfD/YdcC
MEAGFPYARSLVVMRTERTEKKSGKTTRDPHYYMSSLPPDHFEAAQGLELIRGHWAGVEIRNHWRRDALMGEDGSRSRKPNLLANMALIRSTLLAALAAMPYRNSKDVKCGQNIVVPEEEDRGEVLVPKGHSAIAQRFIAWHYPHLF